jgi:hypothetical protein
MYKKIFKHYVDIKKREEKLLDSLHKSIAKEVHPIKDQKPHFIFSAENPLHPSKIKMNHQEVVEFLQNHGYKPQEMEGKYGSPEKSILINNPSKKAIKHLRKLVRNLGQETAIYSDGYNHELHYLNGENAGTHQKGQGTNVHKKTPEDFYSKMKDGTIFTHNFSDEFHPSDKSMLKIKQETLKKSEQNERYKPYISKNEDEHPFSNPKSTTKLIHYSPRQNIAELDPSRQREGVKGSDFRQGKPQHPVTWFYGEGVKPEPIVMEDAKSKYITSLGDRKLYDIGKDPDNIYGKLKEKSKNSPINPGIVDRDTYHSAVRSAGYHGIYNSNMDDTMSRVVGMFEKMPIEAKHNIHPNDHKETTAFNHHSHSERREDAKDFADKTGHHDYNFLKMLRSKLR